MMSADHPAERKWTDSEYKADTGRQSEQGSCNGTKNQTYQERNRGSSMHLVHLS